MTQSAESTATTVASRHPEAWWKTAVVYQVYIRSFADGNGDGVGDLTGLRSKLPYLADLGIDAVWINPWYPSPMADAGYDVADFRDIEPSYGTLAEGEAFIAEAHELGIRVILDIVPNHTSSEHRWFEAALRDEPGARDRYIFRPGRGPAGDEPPNDWQSAFGGPAWSRLDTGEWYLHLFAPAQPDLNWEHPEVRAEFEDILRFWFDKGVDGFRIDVAHGLAKDPALPMPVSAFPVRSTPTPTPRGTRMPSTRCTGAGGPSPTPTPTASSSPRPGCPATTAWPATCAPTSCTPRSSSTSCAPRGVL